MPARAKDFERVAQKLGNWLFYEILKQLGITEEEFEQLR